MKALFPELALHPPLISKCITATYIYVFFQYFSSLIAVDEQVMLYFQSTFLSMTVGRFGYKVVFGHHKLKGMDQ